MLRRCRVLVVSNYVGLLVLLWGISARFGKASSNRSGNAPILLVGGPMGPGCRSGLGSMIMSMYTGNRRTLV